MTNKPQALINLSGNNTVLFIVLGVVIVLLVVRFLMVKSKSPLGNKLNVQDAPFRRFHLVRAVGSFAGAIVFFIALVVGFVNDPSMGNGSNYSIFGIGAVVILVLIIATIANWLQYKSMKQ